MNQFKGKRFDMSTDYREDANRLGIPVIEHPTLLEQS